MTPGRSLNIQPGSTVASTFSFDITKIIFPDVSHSHIISPGANKNQRTKGREVIKASVKNIPREKEKKRLETIPRTNQNKDSKVVQAIQSPVKNISKEREKTHQILHLNFKKKYFSKYFLLSSIEHKTYSLFYTVCEKDGQFILKIKGVTSKLGLNRRFEFTLLEGESSTCKAGRLNLEPVMFYLTQKQLSSPKRWKFKFT